MRNHINTRFLWLVLILLLPSVDLHWMAPHDHVALEHTHAGEISGPLGQLPHSHDDDADPPDQPSHHHHLTNHLDSHDYAIRGRNPNMGLAFVVANVDPDPAARPSYPVIPDLHGPAPYTAPITSGTPRAPPLLG